MNTNNAPIASNASSSKAPTPAKSFRLGRIKAAVWANETDGKTFYNVTFSRTYVGKDQKLHDTDSFGRDDLPLVAKLANEAHTYIFGRLAVSKNEPQHA